ncbi:MAG: hypothetical protein F2825_04905, partial [Actinobacteria bacterium]|nr:hypothetical protein [Actinomycetota bacterium]
SNLTSAHYSDDGARVIRLENVGDGIFRDARSFVPLEHFERLRKHEAKRGDLVVASLGERLPRACLVPDLGVPALVKADCIRIRLRNDIHPKWALYSTQTPAAKRWAEDRLRGVGRQRLGLRGIRDVPVNLPTLDEQHRILTILEDHLSRLDAGRASLEASERRSTKLLRGLVLSRMLGQADSGHSARAAVVADEGDLPRLADGWTWSRLGQLANVVGGITKDSAKESGVDLVEVPYLRVANVQRGRLDLSVVKSVRVPRAKAEALRLLPGDVLMNEGGDRDKLGRGWVWSGKIDNCIHQNHVFRARPHNGVIRPALLSWWTNTIGGEWCERHGRQSVNLASISLRRIREMPVPVPPHAEQQALEREIAEALVGASRLAADVAAATTRAANLRGAILAAAFAGALH